MEHGFGIHFVWLDVPQTHTKIAVIFFSFQRAPIDNFRRACAKQRLYDACRAPESGPIDPSLGTRVSNVGQYRFGGLSLRVAALPPYGGDGRSRR